MGQFSFRVSSNVTVRKWLEPGSSQRFFHLCLILESGRLKKLGLLGYFSLSLSLSLLEWLFQGDPADLADSSNIALDIMQQHHFYCILLIMAVPQAHLVPREGSWTLPPDERRVKEFDASKSSCTLSCSFFPSHTVYFYQCNQCHQFLVKQDYLVCWQDKHTYSSHLA